MKGYGILQSFTMNCYMVWLHTYVGDHSKILGLSGNTLVNEKFTTK